MKNEVLPFDSIESAHEFILMVADRVIEAKLEIEAQQDVAANFPRLSDALHLTFHKLEELEIRMNQSSRILNDLRSVRRLLFEERSASPTLIPEKLIPVTNPANPATPFPSKKQRAPSAHIQVVPGGNGETGTRWYIRAAGKPTVCPICEGKKRQKRARARKRAAAQGAAASGGMGRFAGK